MLVLLASVASFAAPRSDDNGRGTAAEVRLARQAQVSFQIHNLLRGRFDWTVRMTKAIRALEDAGEIEPEPDSGTRTIIDEPDPTGVSNQNDPPPPDDDGDDAGEGPQNSRDTIDGIQPLRKLE
jgi:hypothetical protein